MWIVIISREFDNEILIFPKYKEAKDRYDKEMKSGIQVILTEVIRSNI